MVKWGDWRDAKSEEKQALISRYYEERSEARRRGGLDYHDVEQRSNGLFIGNLRVDGPLESGPDTSRWLSEPAKDILGLSSRARLFRCSCGGWFIAHWSAKQCMGCRGAAGRARLRAYTAQRSAERAERRESRQAKCGWCSRLMAVSRSTKRYCSDTCRQAARRARS
jgi:hypothetical protein